MIFTGIYLIRNDIVNLASARHRVSFSIHKPISNLYFTSPIGKQLDLGDGPVGQVEDWCYVVQSHQLIQSKISADLSLRELLALYVLLPKPFCPSSFSLRTHILVMDFQILLSFYRNMYLHMRTAHTRFGCTPPTGNRVRI